MINKYANTEKQKPNLFWIAAIDDPAPHNANWQDYGIKLYWSPHQTLRKITAAGSIVINNTDGAKEIFNFSYDPEQQGVLRDKSITISDIESPESKCKRLNMRKEDYEIIINEVGERLYRIL